MTSTIAKIEEITFPKRENTKSVVIAGICLVSVLACTYVYFVGKIVFDVIGRRQAEASVRNVQSEVGMLESKYFAELQSLDLNSLATVGLQESHDTLYATRTTNTAQANVNPSL